jgi:hypothetical protein
MGGTSYVKDDEKKPVQGVDEATAPVTLGDIKSVQVLDRDGKPIGAAISLTDDDATEEVIIETPAARPDKPTPPDDGPTE